MSKQEKNKAPLLASSFGDSEMRNCTPETILRVRIQQALSNIPFGGMCHFEYVKGDIAKAKDIEFLSVIANNLESLREVLVDHVQRHNKMESELSDIRASINGFGNLSKLATGGKK